MSDRCGTEPLSDQSDRLQNPSPITHHSSLLLLLGLACLLFFWGLGDLGLTDRDEGRNAEAAREMVETGAWISPTFNYEPRFAKPVFVYWLMGAAYRTFGVDEWSARLPSAVAGVALILLHYGFVARVGGPLVGLISASMLLLNIEIVAIGRMALTDSVLLFWTTGALYCFWLGFYGEGRRRHYLWGFYAGMAAATLTKGPIGFTVPLLTVIPYLLLTGQWRDFWRRGYPLLGTLLLLGLALPWYAAMLTLHGSAYTASAQANTIGRFLAAMEGHGFTVFFYLPILLVGFFPWSGFLPAALYQTFKAWRHSLPVTRHPSRITNDLDLFAAIWLVAGFLFFSLSATRLPHYIAPLFPAAALLAAGYWHRCLKDHATRGLRLSLFLLMGTGYLIGIALLAAPYLYRQFLERLAREFPAAVAMEVGLGPSIAGLLVIIGMGAVGYFGLSAERRAGLFWAAGATIASLLFIALAAVLPRFNAYFVEPPQQLAYAAGVNLGPQDRLILYGPSRPSLIFYAKRPGVFVTPGQEAQMAPLLRESGRTMILLPAHLRSRLPAEAADFQVALQKRGYLLMTKEPMVKGLPEEPPPQLRVPHGLP
jgi:4-amino-4-deoxy-L-arabinose transferase-like glycosyltransferase